MSISGRPSPIHALLAIGTFVIGPEGYGIGRVSAVDDSRVLVAYFDTISKHMAAEHWVEAASCKPYELEVQTRVFWRDPENGDWRAGRIVGHDGNVYFVRFPNSDFDLRLPAEQLHVRWERPIVNPVDVLASGGNETPYFRDARLPMLRELVAQRAACASMPSLLSASVEIYPHQVRTALTVMSDPIPRYLLADEVGLGKTIEAGLVIRQILIDEPTARIAVLVPRSLRHQWANELLDRFFTDDFPEATIKVVSHDNPERWGEYAGFDLVVVDEAHRLVDAADPAASPYAELSALTLSVDRLLLLSATPVVWNEETYLALLHLLDPHLYRWEDRAGFAERLRTRMDLARAVYSMDATFEQLLPSAVNEVSSLIPLDERFAEIAASVLGLLDQQGDLKDPATRTELAARVDALRAHLGETYRLDRRVIRHRRQTVLREGEDDSTLPFHVTGRGTPSVVMVDDPSSETGHDLLLAWQAHVARRLRDDENRDEANAYAFALAVLASRTGGDTDDLLDALRWRWHQDADAARRAGLTEQERRLLIDAPAIPGEDHLVAEAADAGDDLRAIASAILNICSRHPRVVAFCGPGQLARRLAAQLRNEGKAAVAEHTLSLGDEACHRAREAWGNGGVLVADDSAEDGLNLQSANAVVHCRLPWSPNRLEQRLGRVDRYSTVTSQGPAAQFVLSSQGGDYSFHGAWTGLLDTGFGVFSKSISALQAGVERVLPMIWREGVFDGPPAVLRQTETVRTALAAEQKDIDTIDSLEAIYDTDTGLRDVAEAIGVAEIHWRRTQEAVLRYAGSGNGGLRLDVRQSSSQRERLIQFGLGAVAPLMPPRLFARARGTVGKTRTGVFNRNVALRMPGKRLFRIGNPLVDLLANVISVDDRGQAALLWRRRNGEPRVFFGFDYIVEADIAPAVAELGGSKRAKLALRRHADRLLEPFMLRVWVETGMDAAVTDKAMLAVLDRPYEPRQGDLNLNPGRVAPLLRLFGGRDSFKFAADDADETARRHLRHSTDLGTRCSAARDQARRVVAVARAQALARQAAGRLLGDTERFLVDVKVEELLAESLEDPHVGLVCVTCCVVGNSPAGLR